MHSYKELQRKYRSIFNPIDDTIKSFHLNFSQKIVLSDISKQLLLILNLYKSKLDETELKLIEQKLDFYIGSISLDSHSQDILTLHYFNRGKNENYALITNLFQIFNLQFRFHKQNLRLKSTYWKYFQRDIPYFLKSLNREFSKADNSNIGNLYFLLLSSIDAIHNSLQAGDQNFQKSMTSIFNSLKQLLNDKIESDKKLKELIEQSPGFLIYLNYLDELIPDLISNKKFAVETKSKVAKLDFSQINPKSVCFYISNRIELYKDVDKIIKIYNDNKNEIKSSYSYFDFFINAHIQIQKENLKFIGVDIDFNEINEEELKRIIKNLTEEDELKSLKSEIDKIGDIIDWGIRLQSLYEWYQKVPIGIRTIVYTTILRVIF